MTPNRVVRRYARARSARVRPALLGGRAVQSAERPMRRRATARGDYILRGVIRDTGIDGETDRLCIPAARRGAKVPGLATGDRFNERRFIIDASMIRTFVKALERNGRYESGNDGDAHDR